MKHFHRQSTIHLAWVHPIGICLVLIRPWAQGQPSFPGEGIPRFVPFLSWPAFSATFPLWLHHPWTNPTDTSIGMVPATFRTMDLPRNILCLFPRLVRDRTELSDPPGSIGGRSWDTWDNGCQHKRKGFRFQMGKTVGTGRAPRTSRTHGVRDERMAWQFAKGTPK